MKIAIIGGGITGLATALALHKVGLQATVYEQAASLNEIGAGIWMQPNAMKVLQWLNLDKRVSQEGRTLNKMEVTLANLKPVKRIKEAIVADERGNQTTAIHRGKLQHILYNAFTEVGDVELGKAYRSHSLQGDKVTIQFDKGTATADIVLGADGIKSGVRANMGLPSVYRPTGQVCCRGIAHIDLPNELQQEGKEMWGKQMRFGFSEIAEGKVYFFAVMSTSLAPSQLNLDTLGATFAHFHPVVKKIIQSTDQLHTTELEDLKRLPTWHNDHTCLIGDAAHATTPNMGQGACQGMEDAYYLSQLLKDNQGNATFAFRQFEAMRRKKVDYIVNNSWTFGKMAHSPIGQAFMKGIMKLTPDNLISKQMNQLYAVEGL